MNYIDYYDLERKLIEDFIKKEKIKKVRGKPRKLAQLKKRNKNLIRKYGGNK